MIKPKSRYPSGIELEYYRGIKALFTAWWEQLTKELIAQGLYRQDGLFDTLFDTARARWGGIVDAYQTTIRQAAATVERFVTLQFTRQQDAARKATLEEKVEAKRTLTLNIFALEPIERELADFTRENVRLIKSIGEQAADRLDREITDAIKSGSSTKNLKKILRDNYGYATKRAAVIARDQIGKYQGQITRIRHEEAGIHEYIWRTMRDSRVRDKHRYLEGEQREYAQSPIPGQEIQCRCLAEPVF